MCIITIVVRSKKDKDAIEAVVRTFYRGWSLLEVRTLHGARRPEQAREEINSMIEQDPNRYYIVLLGREDEELMKLDKEYPDNILFKNVGKAKVRNARKRRLYASIERGKARVRTEIRWYEERKAYRAGKGRGQSLCPDDNPVYDLYLAMGKHHQEVIGKKMGIELNDPPLIIKKTEGIHEVFCGEVRLGVLKIPDEGLVTAKREVDKVEYELDIKEMVKWNCEEGPLKIHERISLELLRKVKEDYEYDVVIIPWSGGKDSTATLVLALKVFGQEVVPIFVDTGLEFEDVYHYIDKVAELLGVRYEVAQAHIDKAWAERGYELPTRENRWCTKLKIAALYRKMDEIADKPLIVVGDRDTESLLRLKRPPIRWHEGRLQVAPIKMWSALHVQLYLLAHGIPLNPMYEFGFYRIGCYMCPAFRSWELDLAEEYFNLGAGLKKVFNSPMSISR
ncbi:MAG: phosphoadenosine phosphosulfate reductase [Thermoprotei archaeon]|nr:MAG: phosphoadenosine phosphosulfate reductase [Thermoprotei archaeon]RLF24480.1 MAG: phosphoadenosine phosphosulfate reductase [Thermoprotei archaeon]